MALASLSRRRTDPAARSRLDRSSSTGRRLEGISPAARVIPWTTSPGGVRGQRRAGIARGLGWIDRQHHEAVAGGILEPGQRPDQVASHRSAQVAAAVAVQDQNARPMRERLPERHHLVLLIAKPGRTRHLRGPAAARRQGCRGTLDRELMPRNDRIWQAGGCPARHGRRLADRHFLAVRGWDGGQPLTPSRNVPAIFADRQGRPGFCGGFLRKSRCPELAS